MYIKCVIALIFLFLISPCANADSESSGYIVKFRENFVPPHSYELKEINADKGLYTASSLDVIGDLQGYIVYTEPNSAVKLIEGSESISLASVPTDELYSQQWSLEMINADAAWNLETYGNDIKVAVIDSGCYAHEDLKNNLTDGKNYLDTNSDTSDNIGHGTHVSGIIAAEMNSVGITGVAPKAKIVPLKCFDTDKDTFVDTLAAAIFDAVDVYNCQVINMSWGLASDNSVLKEAIDYAYANGVISISSVGNEYSSALFYPAAYDNVIGVGSVTSQKNKSAFSQYNNSVFVTAPGSSILSTYNDGSYKKLSGTSQAAPLVSGLAALMLSMDSSITDTDLKTLLKSTSEDLGDSGYDTKFGHGLINAENLIHTFLADTTVYISPLQRVNNQTGVFFFNLTDETLELNCIRTSYTEGKMDIAEVNTVKLTQDSALFMKHSATSECEKFMAWNNMDSVTPLCKERE